MLKSGARYVDDDIGVLMIISIEYRERRVGESGQDLRR
jgi:hypothetical protein